MKMPSMTVYKQGDILLIPFPFTDQSSVKQRPAVVISAESYNQSHLDIILAPITSQIKGTPDDVLLLDWQNAGLLKPSAVKPILSSFDTKLVRRQLGNLSSRDLASVRILISQILDL